MSKPVFIVAALLNWERLPVMSHADPLWICPSHYGSLSAAKRSIADTEGVPVDEVEWVTSGVSVKPSIRAVINDSIYYIRESEASNYE